jgi:broad specificity phosphatase PhoE
MEGWNKIDVIFIRHGESSNNVTYETVRQKFGESLSAEEQELEIKKLHNPDCALSAKGIAQIEKLKEFIASGGFSSMISHPEDWKLYTSPMNRCLLSSHEVGTAFRKRTTVVPFLFESDGCYESLPNGETKGLPGFTAKEVHDRFPQHDCLPGMENGWYPHAHRETKGQFLDRCNVIADWLWKMQAKSEDDRGFRTGMIITAHGNLIMSVLSALIKADQRSFMISHHNTGYCHIQLWSRTDGTHKIATILASNKVDHLHDSPSLVAGGALVEDHWIQEFLENEDGCR